MFGKLLKYDLKANYKFMLILYGLALVIAGLTRLRTVYDEIFFVRLMEKILNGVVIGVVINIVINCLMRLWGDFKRNLYGDEGYLTHTLPVKRAELLRAKFATGLIFMVVSTVVIVVTLMLAYLTPELKEVLQAWTETVLGGTEKVGLWVVAIGGLVMLEFMAVMCAGFMGLILGYRRLNNRMAWSVVFGFICYIGMQWVVLAGIAVTAAVKPELSEILFGQETAMEADTLRTMMTVAISAYTVDIVVGYFLAQRWFRKIDLD